MIFEDILQDVGSFGPYQKFLVIVFLLPASMVIPWFSMSSIFLSSIPDHWCHVPEVVTSNLSIEAQRQLVSPPGDPRCSMYDVDYGELISAENFSVDPSWPVKECDSGWQFDTTHYDATSVTRVSIAKEPFPLMRLVTVRQFGKTNGRTIRRTKGHMQQRFVDSYRTEFCPVEQLVSK